MLATDRLFLVRHGESTYNAEGRLQGQADPPLTPRGRAEAEALAAAFDGMAMQAIASDLVRARETAALLGHPDAPTDARLREIDVGEWAGRPISDFPPGSEPSWRGGPLVPPGGEAWGELVARVGAAVDDMLDAGGGPWLVVAHGGVVRAAVTHLTGADARQLAGPANASVTVLEGRRLRAYAWTPQLSAG
jgi:glucosyl-3-phosphoglycerate phosphatase